MARRGGLIALSSPQSSHVREAERDSVRVRASLLLSFFCVRSREGVRERACVISSLETVLGCASVSESWCAF